MYVHDFCKGINVIYNLLYHWVPKQLYRCIKRNLQQVLYNLANTRLNSTTASANYVFIDIDSLEEYDKRVCRNGNSHFPVIYLFIPLTISWFGDTTKEYLL